MNNAQTVSDKIVDFLVTSGITTFFGIPGGPVSPIFDSILRCSNARLVESRHETAAAFAAASYFIETGNIAAIVVTAGPGATNAITGVASAYLKKIPIVVICGDVAWADKGERLIQDCGPDGLHVEALYAPITRARIRINQSQSACAQISTALEVATNETYPGPALIVLPIQIGRKPSAEIFSVKNIITKTSAFQDDNTIEVICKLLKNSEKPLLVIGNGCRGMSKELTQVLQRIRIPFVTTPQAKGIVSEEHELSLRHGGLAASNWARKYINEGNDIDVCVALGTDLDDCATGPTRYVKAGTKLVHVDLDSSIFNRNVPAFLPVVTELSSFLNHLLFYLKDSRIEKGEWIDQLYDAKISSPFDDADFKNDNATFISPHRAIADIQRAAPANTRFITDIGEHMLFALHYLTIREPGSFHIHLNLGSMGSGIGGSIGLSLGNLNTPVVCICGDGGMQMIGMEVLVAKKMNLPIVFAIFNDARYNMVYHGFKTLYGYEYDDEMPRIDFFTWAQSMNIQAATIRNPGDLTAGLIADALSSGPLILDILIDRDVRISGAGRNEQLQHMSVGGIAENKL